MLILIPCSALCKKQYTGLNLVNTAPIAVPGTWNVCIAHFLPDIYFFLPISKPTGAESVISKLIV